MTSPGGNGGTPGGGGGSNTDAATTGGNGGGGKIVISYTTGSSSDAVSSQTTLWKSSATSTFGGASYTLATTTATTTDSYTSSAVSDWAMVAISLRPATTSSVTGGLLISTSTRYFHADHLNSTNVVTDASGTPIQILDYYPYGSTRVSDTSGAMGGYNEQKQFIGQYTDPETNLSYLQQRYMNGTTGQFLSEDPSFLAVGNPNQLKQLTQQEQQQFLADPQQMNSYSYGSDNPIKNKDPNGLYPFDGPNTQASGLAKQYLIPRLQAAGEGYYAAAAAAAVGIPASVGGYAITPFLLEAGFAPAISGGLANTANRAYSDSQDGKFDDSIFQYGASFVLGATTGKYSEGRRLVVAMGMGGTSAAVESAFMDRKFSGTQTFAGALGPIGGKIAMQLPLLSGGAKSPQTIIALNQLQQSLGELSAQISALKAITPTKTR